MQNKALETGRSLYSDSAGEPGSALVLPGEFGRQMKEGFGKGASVYGSNARGTWRDPE